MKYLDIWILVKPFVAASPLWDSVWCISYSTWMCISARADSWLYKWIGIDLDELWWISTDFQRILNIDYYWIVWILMGWDGYEWIWMDTDWHGKGYLNICISGCLDVWISGCLDIWEYFGIRTCTRTILSKISLDIQQYDLSWIIRLDWPNQASHPTNHTGSEQKENNNDDLSIF